jgi:hypothetical protein
MSTIGVKTISLRSVELATTTSTTVTTVAGDVVFVGAVSSATSYTLPAQQVSVNEYPAANPNWSRLMRLTNDALFCIRNTAENTVALAMAAWSAIAKVVEPTMSWPPVIASQPSDASCQATVSAATFSVGLGATELAAATYLWQYADATVAATNTLTSNNTNVSDGDTVTIGLKTYTFKTALTSPALEGEVKIGTDADDSLLHLIHAINHYNDAGEYGTEYNCASASAYVTAATSVTSHAFAVTAITAGTLANSTATTVDADTLSWGTTTLVNGGWATATGTVEGCAYTNGTTATLTCTPTTTGQTGVYHRCVCTNTSGWTATDSALLTITAAP